MNSREECLREAAECDRLAMLAMPAIEIAKAEKSFFPSIDVDVLARCIA